MYTRSRFAAIAHQGLRYKLAAALHADDAKLVMQCIEVCEAVALTQLRDESCPSVGCVGSQCDHLHASTHCQDVTVRQIDSALYCCLVKGLKSKAKRNINILETCAFAVAVYADCVKVVSRMLSRRHRDNIDPTFKLGNFEGGKPLIWWACKNGHTTVVSLLLKDQRVDPEADQNSALDIASEKGHLSVVKLLLNDERIHQNENKTIELASRNGHIAVVKLLCKNRGLLRSDNSTSLCLASEFGHIGIVRVLLEDSCTDPSAQSNLALRSAAKHGNIDIVEVLVHNERFNPHIGGLEQPLLWASKNGYAHVVQVLLTHKLVDIRADNDAAVRNASKNGHIEVVRLLLSDGRASPKMAVIPASFSGHVEIVKLLLKDKRVRPSVNDQLSLKLACTGGHLAVVQLLLTYKRVRVSKEVLLDIDDGLPPRVEEGHPELVSECMKVIVAKQPRFWPTLIDDETKCVPGGTLRNELDRLEAQSSWEMLLCVKRKFSARVAARVADVLREVCSEWTRFGTVEEEKEKEKLIKSN